MKKLLGIFLFFASLSGYAQTYTDTQLQQHQDSVLRGNSANNVTHPQGKDLLRRLNQNKLNIGEINRVIDYGTASLADEVITFTGVRVKFGNSATLGPLTGADTLVAPDADPLNFRIDYLVVNRNGTTSIVTGQPGLQGITPSYDVDNQVPIYQILVNDRGVGTVTPVTYATLSEVRAGILTNVALSPNTFITVTQELIDEALAGILGGSDGGELRHRIVYNGDTLPNQPVLHIGGAGVQVFDGGAGQTYMQITGYPYPPNGGNVLYVSPDGSDTEGLRGAINAPFLTIAGAIAASVPGDLIYCFPGTYGTGSENTDFRLGRKLYLSPGAVLNYGSLFFDGVGGSITGAGTINANNVRIMSYYAGINTDFTIDGPTINRTGGGSGNGLVLYNSFSQTNSTPQIFNIRNAHINGGPAKAVHMIPSFGGNYHRDVTLTIESSVITSDVTAIYLNRNDGTDETDSTIITNSSLTLRNSTLLAGASSEAIHAGNHFKYYFSHNYKNRPNGGTYTIVNQLASSMGDGFTTLGTGGSTADGSETKVTAGTNVTVTGTGTTASPYVINSSGGGGGTIDAIATNGSTNAVQSDGVFDALVGKANLSHTHIEAEITDLNKASVREPITQTAHGFSAGQVVKKTGATWQLAQADNASNAEALGVIESVTTNTFVLVTSGKITLSGLTQGATYFLSATTAGLLSTTEPTTAGQVSKPILNARTATEAQVIHSRGVEISGGGGGGYTLPIASASVLGGAKIGANLSIDGSGVLSSTGGDGSETKVAAGTNVTITGNGTIATPYLFSAAGGGGGISTMGSVGSGNANGGSISGSTLTLHEATSTTPGMVSTGAQTWTGAKKFTSAIVAESSTAVGASSGQGLQLFTTGVPAAIYDRLGYVLFGGNNATTNANSAGIFAYADSAWTSTNKGSILDFATSGHNNARSSKMTLDRDGNLTIFENALGNTALAKLDVIGNSTTAGNVLAVRVTGGAYRFRVQSDGRVSIGPSGSTAWLHLPAETASSSTGPIKFTQPGALMSTPQALVLGITTDGNRLTYTTQTGSTRYFVPLSDLVHTAGRIPYTTTGGVFTDNSAFLFSGTNLSVGTTTATERVNIAGNLQLTTAGNKLIFKGGTNAAVGTATLVAGSVTVSTSAVSANSKIFLTVNTPGGTVGFLSAPAASITGGTSFIINSSNALDTSTVNYWIVDAN